MPENDGYRFGRFFKFLPTVFVPVMKPNRHSPQSIKNTNWGKESFKAEGLMVGCFGSPSLGWAHSLEFPLNSQLNGVCGYFFLIEVTVAQTKGKVINWHPCYAKA